VGGGAGSVGTEDGGEAGAGAARGGSAGQSSAGNGGQGARCTSNDTRCASDGFELERCAEGSWEPASCSGACAGSECRDFCAALPATSSAPRWWEQGALSTGASGRWVDDARLDGAFGASGISDTTRFLGLVDAVGEDRFAVLSFQVASAPAGGDVRLLFGFWDETDARGQVFRIGINLGAETPVAGLAYGDGGFTGRAYHAIGTEAWVLNNQGALIPPPLPAWLKDDARVDVFCASTECEGYAVRVRVPIAPDADVSSDDSSGVHLTPAGRFRFFFQAQVLSNAEWLVHQSFPAGLPLAEEEASTTCASIPPYCFPAVEDWFAFDDGASCAGPISLDPSALHLGSAGNDAVSLASTVELVVRPRNDTGAVQPGAGVAGSAWLSQYAPGGGTPADVKLCDLSGTGGVEDGSSFELSCSFSVPDPCAYRAAGDPCGASAGSLDPEQMLRVELRSAQGGGPYVFSPVSATAQVRFVP
jgi:hypothetical protein